MDDALTIETTTHGIFVECRSCGASNYSDKAIMHRRSCSTKSAQYGVLAALVVAVIVEPLQVLGANVRKYACADRVSDADLVKAVKYGYVLELDAMNSDY